MYAINQFSDLSASGLFKPNLKLSNKHIINDIKNNTEKFHGNNLTIEFCNANSINVTNCQKFHKDPLKWKFFPTNECEFQRSYATNATHATDDFQTICAKYEFVHNFLDLIWLNISIEQTSQPTLLNNSNAILNIINPTDVYSEVISIYLTRFGFDGFYYKPIYNSFFLESGQIAIMDYSPIIKSDIGDTYLFGLESRSTGYPYVDLDARMNILPLRSSQNTIQLGIRLGSLAIQYQDEFYPGIGSAISKIGGFFSFLSGVFILLFGASRIAPWGFMQKYIIPCITCMTCRRSLIKNVAKKYISTAGIPFVEKVSEMPASGNLEDRVQIIETLLKEYYLDVEFLEILKKEKAMYHKASQEKNLIYTSVDIEEDDDMKDNK